MANTTIIIPTYNEAENIPLLAQQIKQYVNGSCEVLIMDDSPDDKTAIASNLEQWEVIQRRNREKGLSQSVLHGIKLAKGRGKQAVIIMDADLQHPPKTIPFMLKALEKNDFVVASRYIEGGGIRKWGLKRRLISRVANLLAMPLMKFKVKDMMSGFAGFKSSGLPELSTIQPKGYKIITELLVKGNWNSVVEIPYTFGTREAGESKLGKKQIFEYVKQLIDLYLYKFRFLKFILVGLSGVLVNLIALWFMTDVLNMFYLASAVIASFLSISNNYTWNYTWTFKDMQTNFFTGWIKYLVMASAMSLAYLGGMVILTEIFGLWYLLSAIIAVIITFIGRYVIASEFIWKKQEQTA